MGLIDDVFKEENIMTLSIGIGLTLLGPPLLKVLATAVKPVAKATIKGGLIAAAKGKVVAAEMGEIVEDIVAEAKSELEEVEKI